MVADRTGLTVMDGTVGAGGHSRLILRALGIPDYSSDLIAIHDVEVRRRSVTGRSSVWFDSDQPGSGQLCDAADHLQRLEIAELIGLFWIWDCRPISLPIVNVVWFDAGGRGYAVRCFQWGVCTTVIENN